MKLTESGSPICWFNERCHWIFYYPAFSDFKKQQFNFIQQEFAVDSTVVDLAGNYWVIKDASVEKWITPFWLNAIMLGSKKCRFAYLSFDATYMGLMDCDLLKSSIFQALKHSNGQWDILTEKVPEEFQHLSNGYKYSFVYKSRSKHTKKLLETIENLNCISEILHQIGIPFEEEWEQFFH